MCDELPDAAGRAAAGPRPAEGPAADAISLLPVDEVTVTTLVDNTFDALLVSSGLSSGDVIRPSPGTGLVTAPQFTDGRTSAGLRAEHGFSALVTVRRGTTRSALLFDTGVSPDGMAVNIERLGIDVGDLQGVVLSHGHFDHAGGFDGLARLRGRSGLPLTVHPAIWTRRRLAVPGARRSRCPPCLPAPWPGRAFR